MDVSFIKIENCDHALFNSLWNLYEEAFPIAERRDLFVQKKVMQSDSYRFSSIQFQGDSVGFVLWWDLPHSVYIEHFAVFPSYRGNKIGEQVLNLLKSKASIKPLILEVELPDSDINKRRIGFYQRNGFKLNQYQYYQLPMRSGGEELELKLMSFPNDLSENGFNVFKEEVARNCFAPFYYLNTDFKY